MENTAYMDNDTIDLRELLDTLKKRKKLIYLLTSLITLLAIIYVFVLAKPVYEVKAMIEVAKIEVGKANEKPLENLEEMKQKLNYLHGVGSKKKRTLPRLKSISIRKKATSVATFIVEGSDNTSAKQYMKKIVQKIEKDHAYKTNAYVNTQKELIALTKEDVKVNIKNLKEVQKTLQDYTQKMLQITQSDAALAGLYVIQMSQNQERLSGLERHTSALKSKVFNMELSISPLRIKPTRIIGNIEILDKPVKPKKVLIVIVAFITGLLFSVFLVLFLAFLKGIEEEK